VSAVRIAAARSGDHPAWTMLRMDAVAEWTCAQGCRELASDAALDNLGGHAAHRACGFGETERVVYFRRALGD